MLRRLRYGEVRREIIRDPQNRNDHIMLQLAVQQTPRATEPSKGPPAPPSRNMHSDAKLDRRVVVNLEGMEEHKQVNANRRWYRLSPPSHALPTICLTLLLMAVIRVGFKSNPWSTNAT